MYNGSDTDNRGWTEYVIYDVRSLYYDRNDAWTLRISGVWPWTGKEEQSTFFYNPVRNVQVGD
jgi:hypothetical protein